MSRNKIETNKRIFCNLDAFCAKNNDPIRNAGKPRWIDTNKDERQFLVYAEKKECWTISQRKHIVRFEYAKASFLFCIGFDHAKINSSFEYENLDSGMMTALIGEINLMPCVSSAEIRNIIEVFDKESDPSYNGHDCFAMATIFPTVQVLRVKDIDVQRIWCTYFLIGLSEAVEAGSWIDYEFADTLSGVCALSNIDLPYETLCRSIFDVDPGAMFLALYRCLEAVYAYSSAAEIIRQFDLRKTWTDVAVVLERHLGWRAAERNTLINLVNYAEVSDARDLIIALGESCVQDDANLKTVAANHIYDLRNSLVHYRPVHQTSYVRNIDWNRTCQVFTVIIHKIYDKIFQDKL